MTALPAGFRIAVDPDTKELDAATLSGGSPTHVLRLTPAGARAWKELRHDCAVSSRGEGVLARRLTDAGLAHPRPGASARSEVTVVIPVRDRTALLERCLSALGAERPVVVVDDGSVDPEAIAAVARHHGARLLRRDVSGGPGTARNTGLGHVEGEFVAFLDSDCVPPRGWIDTLAAHFADPLVGAVAPRIVAEPSISSAGRYAAQFGSLDLGPHEARVVPASRVAYVPTAALLVRRAALAELGTGDGVFDPALRYGEDVDLIWRLHEAGWRIRYDPSVAVAHREPDTWTVLLSRRFRYGTSAAPLTRRHPRSMHPLVLHAGPAATVAALLARRPLLAVTAFATYFTSLTRTLTRARIPANRALPASLDAIRQTWIGLGRYLSQFAAPVLIAGLALRGRRRWGRRAALASLLLAPALTPARSPARTTGLDPARRAAARLGDDIAYGAGVWTGCVRERTFTPLLPAIAWRPLRIAPAAPGTERSPR